MAKKHHWLVKHYRGLMEDWKIQLALNRIRRMGFRSHEWPDLMQELAMILISLEHDSEHAAGASEETLVFSTIHHHLLTRMRSASRRRRRFDQVVTLQGYSPEAPERYAEPSYELDEPLRLDLQEAVHELRPLDVAVCERLARGLSKSDIAKELSCDWHTVNLAMERIRKHLAERGLNEVQA